MISILTENEAPQQELNGQEGKLLAFCSTAQRFLLLFHDLSASQQTISVRCFYPA